MASSVVDRIGLRQRVGLMLEFEPSWFAEAMSATGIFWWAAFALLSDDFDMHASAYVMPCLGLVAGPLRAALLFRLNPMPRVAAAAAGFVWWTTLLAGLMHQYGSVPMEGACLALMVGDALTVAKFSIWAWRLMHPRTPEAR